MLIKQVGKQFAPFLDDSADILKKIGIKQHVMLWPIEVSIRENHFTVIEFHCETHPTTQIKWLGERTEKPFIGTRLKLDLVGVVQIRRGSITYCLWPFYLFTRGERFAPGFGRSFVCFTAKSDRPDMFVKHGKTGLHLIGECIARFGFENVSIS